MENSTLKPEWNENSSVSVKSRTNVTQNQHSLISEMKYWEITAGAWDKIKAMQQQQRTNTTSKKQNTTVFKLII